MMLAIVRKARNGFPSPGFSSLVLLLAASAALAQPPPTVTAVSVEGTTVFSDNEIISQLATVSGASFDSLALAKDLQTLEERYVREGFMLGVVRAEHVFNPDSASVSIAILIDEGKRFLVDSVYWSGADSLPVLPSILNPAPGDVFSTAALERGIQEALLSLEGEGFPLASISVSNLVFEEREDVYGVRIFLTVSHGERARISRITIRGNAVTKDHVITRELRLDGSEHFTDALAGQLQRRLERLRLFSAVLRPEFVLTREGGGLLIQVREGAFNRFDGILGYIPAGGTSQGGFVTGFVDIQLGNLFGTGRRLSTRWVRESPATQDLSLRYFEPWVAGVPINAEGGFAQRKQDSTYVRRSYDLGLTLMVTEDLTLGLSIEQTSVFPSERLLNPVGRGSKINIGGSIRYDARDDPITPRSGVLYMTSYEWGSKTVTLAGKESGDRTARLSLDLEYYLAPFRQQVIAAAFHGRDFQSTLIDQSDLFRLGGTTTLRGYREGQFLGSRVLWSSIEYRFLVGRRSFVYGFADAGFVTVPDRPAAGLAGSEITRIGYGIGLRIDSGIGLIGVNLAFGQGDTFSTAKLHFRLINEF